MTDQISICLNIKHKKGFCWNVSNYIPPEEEDRLLPSSKMIAFPQNKKKLSNIFMNFAMVRYEEKYTITSV